MIPKATLVNTGITTGAALVISATSSLEREMRSPVPASSTVCCGTAIAWATTSSRSSASTVLYTRPASTVVDAVPSTPTIAAANISPPVHQMVATVAVPSCTASTSCPMTIGMTRPLAALTMPRTNTAISTGTWRRPSFLSTRQVSRPDAIGRPVLPALMRPILHVRLGRRRPGRRRPAAPVRTPPAPWCVRYAPRRSGRRWPARSPSPPR